MHARKLCASWARIRVRRLDPRRVLQTTRAPRAEIKEDEEVFFFCVFAGVAFPSSYSDHQVSLLEASESHTCAAPPHVFTPRVVVLGPFFVFDLRQMVA